MTKEELKKLKDSLPINWAYILNKKLDFSVNYIRGVVNGRKNNIKILKAAVELAVSYQKEITELSEKINTL